ncbi:hypothetical protein SAMN05216331_10683 [Porphyromonadaceae bacterium KH3R12]|nr:hypothetical protein SAMN05216331_10683 [Porphyromonadaceae bacterium KH3R12]
MNVAGILTCLSILFCAVDVQAQSHSREQPLDSVPVLAGDSLLRQVSDSVSVDLKNGGEVAGKQDSVITKTGTLIEMTSDKFFAPSHIFSPSPRKAVIYSAILPGLGQIYNRKYWKLPIVYGAYAGLTYAITWNNGYYRDYLGAYQDIMDDDPTTNRWHDMLPYAYRENPESVDAQWFTEVLQQRKDHYRYYRDLSIIATVGVYLVFIIDAYVDAQLFDFNMSPDLSMRVAPALIRGEKGLNLGSTSYGLQLSFNF